MRANERNATYENDGDPDRRSAGDGGPGIHRPDLIDPGAIWVKIAW